MICIELPSLHRELREMRARDDADQLATERDYGDVDCGIDQLVVTVGRSRLTVRYQIKTGAARTAVVHVSTVTVP